MKTKATKTELTAAKKIFAADSGITRKHRWIKKHNSKSYKTWDTWDILPVFVIDHRFFCAHDYGFGHNIVIDLKDSKCYTANCGIFTDGWCFLSAYHGYDKGGSFFYLAS